MSEGGFVICRPKPITYKIGETHGFRLMSDLHIGSPDVDYALITKELQQAKKNNDRILINGDVFDFILPSDHKRFSPDVLHPRLRGRRDVLNAAIDWAVEIFAPYAPLIDMIGVGNHETSVEKHHHLDPILLLLDKLAPHHTHTLHYGGYTGFLDYRFSRRNNDREGGTRRIIIYYHHGSGGAAPVTKGMIDFSRKQWVSADVLWLGHKHNRWNSHSCEMKCPVSGEAPVLRDVRHIMTGSYFTTYHGQSQRSLREKGRLASYAADLGLSPQGKGGARFLVHQHRVGFTTEVTQ